MPQAATYAAIPQYARAPAINASTAVTVWGARKVFLSYAFRVAGLKFTDTQFATRNA